MGREPVADRATAVAGEVIGDEVQIPLGIGLVERLQQREVACWCCARARSGSGPAHRARTAPHRPRPCRVPRSYHSQGHLDAVAIRRPARSRAGNCAGLRGRVRRRRGPSPPRVARCRARRCWSFWDEIRILARGPQSRMAPAHAFAAEDAPHLAAGHLDAPPRRCGGQRIERPLRLCLRVRRRQFAGQFVGRLAWWGQFDEGENRAALLLASGVACAPSRASCPAHRARAR